MFSLIVFVKPIYVLAEHLPGRRCKLAEPVMTVGVADRVIAHAMDPIRDIGVRDKESPPRGGIFAALGDDFGELLDHRLNTAFVQFEVVRQFGVEFLELARIVIGVGNCRPDVLPPRLNNVKT